MKTTSEILRILEQFKPIATEKYGVRSIGVFGSVARGEQTDASDVDICYEGKAPSLQTLDRMESDLEDLLGTKVDMVRIRDNMNHLLKQRIQREGMYV